MLRTSVPAYFKERRQKLMGAHPNSAFLIPANPVKIRNSNVHYPYRQDSNFYFLSGLEEANTCMLLVNTSDACKSVLFIEDRDPKKELWEGEMYGLSRGKSVFGFDETYVYSSLQQTLPALLKGIDKLYYKLGQDDGMDKMILAVLTEVKRIFGRSGRGLLDVVDYEPIVGELRLKKAPEELEKIRKACEVSARAHLEVMKHTRSGMKEFELDTLFEYLVRKEGCKRLGYGAIVGSGNNATCLHYHKNEDLLVEGDLLLIDAGAEFDYYTADITRTFPVGLKYSGPQADIYDLVLSAQKEALKVAKPGGTMPAIHLKTCEVITQGLLDLKILKGNLTEAMEQKKYERYYPHQAGHWLGMDVHDSGLYRQADQPRPLEENMLLTIEPGLYFRAEDNTVAETWRGIGVRIEDDVLITAKGHEVLTQSAPKERADVEALRH